MGTPSSSTSSASRRRSDGKPGENDNHEGVPVELGAAANPPGFDAELMGLEAGDEQDVHGCTSPPTTPSPELAGTDVAYTVTVNDIRKRACCRSSTTSSRRTSASSTRSRRCARGCAQDLEHEAREAAERAGARRRC